MLLFVIYSLFFHLVSISRSR